MLDKGFETQVYSEKKKKVKSYSFFTEREENYPTGRKGSFE